MNRYLPFPGELTLPPPGTFEQTSFFYFFLRPDPARLKACCDRYLNDRVRGSGLSYSPLGMVALAFSHVERLVSADRGHGSIRYKDIAFWVPVLARSGEGARLCLFPPAIFVDEPATMVTGRELFGLPKQLGRFEMPLRPEELPAMAAPQFRLEVLGTLQPGGRKDWRTLLTITAGPDVGRPSWIRRALNGVAELAQLLELGDNLGGLTLPQALGTLRSVGLRQYRDPADPELASYAAVVEAPLRTRKVLDGPELFLNAFEIDLEGDPVPSHRVAEELGLRPGRHKVPWALYLRADMEMLPAQTVWRQP